MAAAKNASTLVTDVRMTLTPMRFSPSPSCACKQTIHHTAAVNDHRPIHCACLYDIFVMLQLTAVLMFVVLLGAATWGITQVEDGLDVTDLVPRHTTEFRFLEARQKYFDFYYMFAVTQGNFDYPKHQKLLHDYHDAFTRIGNIIKNDDGGLPEFWLPLLRDWLISKCS
ncbi:PREDICTED: protein patched-like [Priapulus caudatus]|uniref:Protein patched-like n=1 Tax=Priapulus caudatus TaxID=37621 RepID=A0ABM1F5N2_PRICU|nr:PREDICTED: protein patched-like [Priapulus caudatus]